MGLANYYSKFMKGFTTLAAPLKGLCIPRASFHWDQAEQACFNVLKAALILVSVLRVWKSTQPTQLITDASELAIGAILEQQDDQWDWHPVVFESCKNTLPKWHYTTHLLELLAVVHALHAFWPYLLNKPFDLHTDNTSLQWLQEQHTISHHHVRWLDAIAELKFKVVHIQGSTNQADFITRKSFISGPGQAPIVGYTSEGQKGDTELFFAGGKTSCHIFDCLAGPFSAKLHTTGLCCSPRGGHVGR